ncbi:hypothetical protein J7337_007768 [Fusarium musae]|uniref:Uncharacterized protein n=1 Tax=Fusarium musae TaxID=1042133 RepID=A0A9P8IP40_9HYPO|nr:hypothetical protein J7337_007768 [Fusarium musae]KAG9502056.1 hypothetical protein J7337_007768 [Fusarium musae]
MNSKKGVKKINAVTTDISAFPFDCKALGPPKLSRKNKVPSCKGLPGAQVYTRKGMSTIMSSAVRG